MLDRIPGSLSGPTFLAVRALSKEPKGGYDHDGQQQGDDEPADAPPVVGGPARLSIDYWARQRSIIPRGAADDSVRRSGPA